MENNRGNIQKNVVVFSLIIVALAIIVVWQQWQIRQLKGGQAFFTAKMSDFDRAKTINDNLSATKAIIGTVVSFDGNQVVVKTNLIDVTALATLDTEKFPILPSIEKNLTIGVTSVTTVFGKIIAGSPVSIQTRESVYGDGPLTAVSITVFDPPQTCLPAITSPGK